MYAVVLVLHIVVSLLLIVIILIQGGRGGMAEAFGGSGSQSLFGGGANIVMTKITAVGASIFLVTCLTLAKLSAERGRSIVDRLPDLTPEAALPGVLPPEAEPITVPVAPEGALPVDTVPADAAPAETTPSP